MKQVKEQEFFIELKEEWIFAKESLQFGYDYRFDYSLQILEYPHRKWWKILFQWVTFGLYKTPYQYKCKIKENER